MRPQVPYFDPLCAPTCGAWLAHAVHAPVFFVGEFSSSSNFLAISSSFELFFASHLNLCLPLFILYKIIASNVSIGVIFWLLKLIFRRNPFFWRRFISPLFLNANYTNFSEMILCTWKTKATYLLPSIFPRTLKSESLIFAFSQPSLKPSIYRRFRAFNCPWLVNPTFLRILPAPNKSNNTWNTDLMHRNFGQEMARNHAKLVTLVANVGLCSTQEHPRSLSSSLSPSNSVVGGGSRSLVGHDRFPLCLTLLSFHFAHWSFS